MGEHDDERTAATITTADEGNTDAPSSNEAHEASDNAYKSLSFDQAEFRGPPAASVDSATAASAPTQTAFSCQACKAGITGEYYTINQQALCPGCQGTVRHQLAQSSGGLGRALLFGMLAVVGGALVHYAVSAITGYELALISIVIGIAVGKAVRYGAGLNDHWIYRALGLALTWVSIVAAYIPDALAGLEAEPTNLIALVVASFIALIAPFLMLAEGEIMSIIIIGIGLWEGWRFSAAPKIEFDGPFRVGAPAPAALAAAGGTARPAPSAPLL